MQFRERRRVIQVIRTVYDPAIKRGRAELVGRLDKDDPRITDDIRAACTAEEVQEIATYLTQRREAVSREVIREAALNLAANMRMAETFFRLGQDDSAGGMATDIFAAWDDLKKAMHKAGYRKEKGKNHAVTAATPGRVS